MNTTNILILAHTLAVRFNDVISTLEAHNALCEHAAFDRQLELVDKYALIKTGMDELNKAQRPMPNWRDIDYYTVVEPMGDRMVLKIEHHKHPVTLLVQVAVGAGGALSLDRLMLRDTVVRGFDLRPFFDLEKKRGRFEVIMGGRNTGGSPWSNLQAVLAGMVKMKEFDRDSLRLLLSAERLLADHHHDNIHKEFSLP